MRWDLRDLRTTDRWRLLLELRLGDSVLRFSDQGPVEADVDADGTAELWDRPMEVGSISDAVAPYQGSPREDSVELTLYLEDVSPPARIERGEDFGAARGRLYLWSPETSTAELLIQGVLDGVEYGTPTEPITASLREELERDAGRFPPAAAIVDATTWPNAADSAVGERYPWILGRPGAGAFYVAPALFVDTSTGAEYLLVAGHPVEATTVGVINDDDGTTDTLSIVEQEDGAGRVVSVVALAGSSLTVDSEAPYFVAWGGAGGGLERADGGLVRGAGDVLRWILGYSTLPIDHGRLAAVLAELNGYQIDTVISAAPDTRFSPWDWIADHLLEILPVAMRASSEGVYPVIWRTAATEQDAVAHLEVPAAGDPNPVAALDGPVSYSNRDDVATEIAVAYGRDPRLDAWARRVVLTGDPTRAQDAGVSLNLYCAQARTRYRDSRGEPLTIVREVASEVIWDAGTAGAVAGQLAQRYAGQQRLVSVVADVQVAGHLDPGEVVTVTCSDLSWTRKVCVVEDASRSVSATVRLALRVVEDGARVRKAT